MEHTEVVDRLERNLMSLGVYVERHAFEDDTLHVEYETADGGLTQNDLGNVCTELVEIRDAGWEPIDCHFWAFTTEEEFLGEWEIRAGWLRALDRGDISQTDFSTLVLSTRQPAEDPPVGAPGSESESPSR